MSKDIIVCGDVHAYFDSLTHLINEQQPKVILQCGDFGWWPRWKSDKFDPFAIEPGDTQIYFAPGNHEDWDELSLRKAEFSKLMPNVWYAQRGATLKLLDGRVVMFVGGAYSIDKVFRTQGVNWFPQEIIPQSVVYDTQGIDKVDIMITHTCPSEFNDELFEKRPYHGWEAKFDDPSQKVLSYLLHKYKPSLWYFGHFHVSQKGIYKQTGTKWFALNQVPEDNWYRYLD